MIITINTDASFSKARLRGAYAFWIVCNAGRIKKHGPIRSKVKNPTEAELKCIVNALHTLKESGWLNSLRNHVIINTDSKDSISLLENNKNEIAMWGLMKKSNLHASAKFFSIKETLGNTKIEFRHVKAHSGKDDARSYVNEWCDKMAKMEMGKILAADN